MNADSEYSKDELATLRTRLSDESAPARCPRCDHVVAIGYPIAGGTLGEYWQVDCTGCGATGTVGNVPRSRRPPPPTRNDPPRGG